MLFYAQSTSTVISGLILNKDDKRVTITYLYTFCVCENLIQVVFRAVHADTTSQKIAVDDVRIETSEFPRTSFFLLHLLGFCLSFLVP